MAIINKTGITNGGTIQAEHVTRAIDALSGGSTDTIVATGSFSGSFKGDGASLTGIIATTAATASYVLNAVSSSFSTTASFALNASGTGFPFTGSARITGSLLVTGSFEVSRSLSVSTATIDMRSSTVQIRNTSVDIETNSITISSSNATINSLTQINNGLTISPAYGTSFRSPVVSLNNSSTFTESALEYDAGTIFIVDRSIGSSTVDFDLLGYDPSIVGTSYKFIFPYSGSGVVRFNDAGSGTLQGVYTDPTYTVKNITSQTTFQITDADHCIVEATAVGSDGETWFLRVVSYGTV